MKTKKSLLVLMAIVLVFTTCGGEENDNTSNAEIKVQGKDVYDFEDGGKLLSSSINEKVIMVVGGKGNYIYEQEVGNITNGKLSFTLPDLSAIIANGEQLDTGKLYRGNYEANPPDAKYLVDCIEDWTLLYFKPDDGDKYMLFYGDFDNVDTYEGIGLYLYLDKPATVKGTFENQNDKEIFDWKFTKGWNFVYLKVTEVNNMTTVRTTYSSQSIKAGMKWYCALL